VTAGMVVGAFFLLGVGVLLTHQHLRHPCRLLPPPTEAVDIPDDVPGPGRVADRL
jgi:hypothetical protein